MTTQNPGTHSPPVFQPGTPLFAIRGCLLLAAFAQWLCGRIWLRSRSIVVQAGGFYPPHMWLQLREGKSLVPAEHCHSPRSQISHRADATQIGLIFSAWRKEGKKESRNLSAAMLHACLNNEPEYIFVHPFSARKRKHALHMRLHNSVYSAGEEMHTYVHNSNLSAVERNPTFFSWDSNVEFKLNIFSIVIKSQNKYSQGVQCGIELSVLH